MMCAHRKRSGCFEFVFILHFSFDVVSVILRGESYCCLVNVYNLMAHANETVVLALILFFFVFALWYLYCLPCSFLFSVTSCFLHAFTRKTNQARLLCAVGLISFSCPASRHMQRTFCGQLDNSLSCLFYFELSTWLSLNGHILVILRQ